MQGQSWLQAIYTNAGAFRRRYEKDVTGKPRVCGHRPVHKSRGNSTVYMDYRQALLATQTAAAAYETSKILFWLEKRHRWGCKGTTGRHSSSHWMQGHLCIASKSSSPRKNLFSFSVAEHWTRLPTEVLEFPSLKTFKTPGYVPV